MSIFARYGTIGADAIATESLIDQAVDATQTAEQTTDPLQEVDPEFAQERQTAELDQNGEQTQENTTNEDLPEGTFGDDPKPTGNDDVKVDADDTKTTFTSAEDGDCEDEDDVVDDGFGRELDDEEAGIEMAMQEISMIADAGAAVESYGTSPSALAVMQISGLLGSTALEQVGLESFSVAGPEDAQSMMATEALGEKIKEKAAALAARVISAVKSGAEKVLALISPLWDKVSGLATSLASKAWDGTKAAGRTIKAHPYATIAAVVTAIVAVAGIVAFAGGAPAMGAKAELVKSYLSKIVGDINSKVKFPGGKISAALADTGHAIKITTGKAGKAIASAASSAAGAAKDAGAAVAKAGTDAARTVVQGADKAAGAAKAGAQAAGKAVGDAAGKVAAAVTPAAKPAAYQPMAGNYAMGSATKLGWTQQSVKAIQANLGRAWTALKGGWDAFGTKSAALAKGAGTAFNEVVKTPATKAGMAVGRHFGGVAKKLGASGDQRIAAMVGGAALGAAGVASMIVNVVMTLVKLVHFVVVGGFRMIVATFNALTGNTQAAAA